MGVKSLWRLLSPAGRPVMLETVEGKSMAIDSSIWIYQFQATMRDKEGRGLVNAHVLGFLRRICKLLFYGIRPVFVFDGGAPALKRMTIAERKRKKSGAAESHEKIAQKLLAAQMRREALTQAQSSSSDTNKPPQGPVTLDENTVYLEDLDASAPPRTPAKNKSDVKQSPSSSAKKSKWRDHDPYRLPDVDMDAAIAKATRSSAPDPRLATEDELRTFIEMLRPEDLDVTSPAFRELPTEVQYEIIGDLRLRSRQTSHKRLQAMLRRSRSALDFSRAQILNLKQRNALTQQLLETTDSIGKANVSIPIRIASERNKEYVLLKNEDEIGGWVLGIRDDGTADKPIVLDNADEHIKSDQESDDEMDMEEVVIPQTATMDPDLREYRRELALAGFEKRRTAAAARGKPKNTSLAKEKAPKKQPLFIPDADEGEANIDYDSTGEWEDDEDAELVDAMRTSLEEQEASDLRRAIEESRKVIKNGQASINAADSDDDLYVDFTPSRLDTALRFAYNSQEATKISPPVAFQKPSVRATSPSPRTKEPIVFAVEDEDEDTDMEEVKVPPKVTGFQESPSETQANEAGRAGEAVSQMESHNSDSKLPSISEIKTRGTVSKQVTPPARQDKGNLSESEPQNTNQEQLSSNPDDKPSTANLGSSDDIARNLTVILDASEQSVEVVNSSNLNADSAISVHTSDADQTESQASFQDKDTTAISEVPGPDVISRKSIEKNDSAQSSEDEGWSHLGIPGDPEQRQGDANEHEEGWDAAEEMDVHEETGEFARFAAQVRGRDVDTVRAEIDEEIRQLHQQRKVAMRDSEDVNQAMVAQIMTMLRLFGIPYITAPMEAEAQCSTLVELGLVDGVITDDSDAFLFGAKRVYKNMFNQSKTVECFLLTDLARELGLDRGTLIRLAYLLGSDYVLGLPGVGPVVAMELLREFPGDDGLHKFKDWWSKVQSGRDKESDTTSTFKKRFKKRFKDLYLPSDWPNPAVRDAYYHPVVDSSEEPFKWGLPDLDGLRSFFHEELSWNADKVDELLQPIIHKMNKRRQEVASNRQGTLNNFMSISEGGGAAEPRRREAYASRRLQALVSAHRKAQKQHVEGSQREGSEEAEENVQPAKKRRKKESPVEGDDSTAGSTSSRGGRGRRGTTRSRRGRGGAAENDSRDECSGAPPESKGKPTKGGSKLKGKSKRSGKSDKDSSDEFVSTSNAAPVREMELRKRVRPRPAYQSAKTSFPDNDEKEAASTAGQEDEGVQMDDSGSSGSEYQG